MKAFSKYKSVRLDWLNEIPEHWDTSAIKHLGNGPDALFMDGDWIESPVITDQGIRYITTGNIGPGFFKAQGSGYISEKTFKDLDCTEVFPGDLIVSRLNEPLARACIIPDLNARIVTSVDNVIFRPKAPNHRRYLMHLFNTPEFAAYASILARGATMQRLSRGQLGNIRIPLPPAKEQQAIATFLDHQTGLIDELIEKNTKLLELLDDQRKAIINEVVTKGVGADGSIRDGWHRNRLKHIGNLYGGLTGKSGSDFYQPEHPKSRPYIPFKNIAGGMSINPTMVDHVVIEEGEEQNQVRSGDIFFLMSSETYEDIARSSILLHDLEDTYLNSFCRGFRITDARYDPPFINYYLQSSDARQRMAIEANGFTRINIQTGKVKNFEVVAPDSKKAQIEIREFLDEQMALLDGIVLSTGQMMEALLDYRRSLISEAVTGKIDLREWEPAIKQVEA